ncbi:MAG: glycosyltransferase [Bacteroidia bacterium]|nr:glycosyltransferase [Bacteroidia bacterium]
MKQLSRTKKIAVLMASYNGINWVEEQLQSILLQEDVDYDIYISDDMSDDGTWEWLTEVAQKYQKINLLKRENKFGTAGNNFYHLIMMIDASRYDYFALADQDDIWSKEKLKVAIDMLDKNKADGYSSNVEAFWADGRKRIIDKAQTQTKYDYLFSAPGPGCTFVLTKKLITKVKNVLSGSTAREIDSHDWLIYAICRSIQLNWVIDPIVTMHYRQHSNNVMGSNSGFSAYKKRHSLIRSGWYKSEVEKILEVSLCINEDDKIAIIYNWIKTGGIISAVSLFFNSFHFRRALKNKIILGLYFLSGKFWP